MTDIASIGGIQIMIIENLEEIQMLSNPNLDVVYIFAKVIWHYQKISPSLKEISPQLLTDTLVFEVSRSHPRVVPGKYYRVTPLESEVHDQVFKAVA